VRRAVIALVLGCGAPATPPIGNASPNLPVPATLPCGVSALHELALFDDARCDVNGTCFPGTARRSVGPCTIARSPAFDLDAGRGRHVLLEDGRPILSSDPPPFGRTVVFDARIATPKGLRVGMTGAEIERLVPPGETTCTVDDSEWRGHLLCRFRDLGECDAEDANWLLVVFDPGDRMPASVRGAAARALVRTRHVLAIDLGPSCGEE
jgi:hypothetical protein